MLTYSSDLKYGHNTIQNCRAESLLIPTGSHTHPIMNLAWITAAVYWFYPGKVGITWDEAHAFIGSPEHNRAKCHSTRWLVSGSQSYCK